MSIISSSGSSYFKAPSGPSPKPSFPGGSLSFNIRDFGALGDGITDDTPAIQAALNAASLGVSSNFSGNVLVPHSSLPYVFTNLIIPPGVTLRGEGGGMFNPRLQRQPGSVGTAITDQASAGGTGISLAKLQIQGNSTTGNGVDLGNQGGQPDWNSFAVIEDVVVRDFTSGIGFNLKPDAVHVRNIGAWNNNQGIVTTGFGETMWFGLFLASNLTNDLVLNSTNDRIFGVHIEPLAATSIQINGNDVSIFGIEASVRGNLTNLIAIATGLTGINLYGIGMGLGGHTVTNLINPAAWPSMIVPGTVTRLAQWSYSGNGSYFVDPSHGRAVRLGNSQGLEVSEGTNAKQGIATLVAGTVTVANTSVTANSRIFLTSQADGGTPGFLRVSARVAGTSLTITSSSGTDTSTVAYEIFEPGP